MYCTLNVSCELSNSFQCQINAFAFLERQLSQSKLRRLLPTALFVCFFAQQPPVGHGLLIHEFSSSHITTRHTR